MIVPHFFFWHSVSMNRPIDLQPRKTKKSDCPQSWYWPLGINGGPLLCWRQKSRLIKLSNWEEWAVITVSALWDVHFPQLHNPHFQLPYTICIAKCEEWEWVTSFPASQRNETELAINTLPLTELNASVSDWWCEKERYHSFRNSDSLIQPGDGLGIEAITNLDLPWHNVAAFRFSRWRAYHILASICGREKQESKRVS